MSNTAPQLSPTDSTTRTWAMAAHASALAALVVGLPFLGPLIVYVMKKDDPIIAAHAREALNFNITVCIAELAIFLVMIATMAAFTPGLFLLGMMAIVGITIAWIILCVRALSRAQNGHDVRYPFTLRFVR